MTILLTLPLMIKPNHLPSEVSVEPRFRNEPPTLLFIKYLGPVIVTVHLVSGDKPVLSVQALFDAFILD